MMRLAYRRALSSASGACAATTLVWIAMIGLASTAQASPGDTELVSVSPMTGVSAQRSSFGGGPRSISADGRFVVFLSDAPDLVAGPSNDHRHAYIRDRGTGSTERISVTPAGLPSNGFYDSYMAVSADGRYVAFDSYAWDLVAGDTNGECDVFVRDRQTGSTERVSISSDGTQSTGCSRYPSMSGDGRYVAFSSDASNLVAGDTNGQPDAFVRDRATGFTARVSIGTQVTSGLYPAMSSDGRYVAFADSGSVFVRDRQTGTTERVSVSTSGEPGNGINSWPAISADGRYVAFHSSATNLVPGVITTTWKIYVRDRVADTTERVSTNSAGIPSISADGRYVAFDVDEVFVYDRQLRTTTRASVNSSGLQANEPSYNAALSADGRFVAFNSNATNLVENDTNGDYDGYDVFVHELGGTSPPIVPFTIKPTALVFGNQALSTSATLSVWVTNKGVTPLPITSVSVVGLNPGMFSANNRCGSSVAVGASCSVRVTFRPPSVGAKSAKLKIVAGDNDVRTKALSGTGVVSAFGVSPTALDFGNVPINTTTPAKVVTIANTGSAVLPISSITLAGWNPNQFAQTHNCPANLAVGASCTIKVVFKPIAPIGSKAALLNITPGGGAAIRSVALVGAARR
jgi:Tol biopolymer transport system component